MLNAAHIAPQAGGYEPQRAYHWMVELYGAPGQSVLTLSMQEAFLPEESSDVIEVPFMTEVRKVAGKIAFRAGNLVYADYVDQPTYSSIQAWRKLVTDPATGVEGLASSYKKSGAIILLGPNGASMRVFKLEGCWPSSSQGGSLSYGSSEQVKITVTLEYDKAIAQF